MKLGQLYYKAEVERLRPCLENALQAMSSVAGRLRVEAKADNPDLEAIERDGNLLAALCPPIRAALSPESEPKPDMNRRDAQKLAWDRFMATRNLDRGAAFRAGFDAGVEWADEYGDCEALDQ